MRLSWLRRGGLFLFLSGLTGCGLIPTPPPPGASTPPPDDVEVVAWSWDAERPVTRFRTLGTTLVGLTAERGRLRITGLDPTTGAVAWQRDADPGWTPSGVRPFVVVGDELAVFLEPSSTPDDASTPIVAVRADGSVATRTTAAYRVLAGSMCGASLCFTADEDGRVGEFRLDLVTAEVEPAAPTATAEVNRPLGAEGLVSIGDGEPFLGRVVDGRLRWRTSFRQLFGEGFGPEGGWSWTYHEEEQMFTGAVGATGSRRDLAASRRTVGVDARTGRLRWRDTGTTPFCGLLDVVGLLDLDDGTYRCRYRGINGDRLEGVGLALERFDPVTGRTRWSVATDPYTGPHAGWTGEDLRIVGDRTIRFEQGSRSVDVDLASGAVTDPDPRARLWCIEQDPVPFDDPRYDGDVPYRSVEPLVERCTASDATLRPDGAPPGPLAEPVGELRVITGPYAVTAVRDG